MGRRGVPDDASGPRPGDAAGSEALDQLRQIQAVTDAALSQLTVDALLDELLERVRGALRVDTVAILLLSERRTELIARAAKGIEEEVEQGVRIPVGRGFAGTIAATQQPVIIEAVDHSNVMNPILQEKGIRSLLGVPLITQGQLIGVMHVGTLVPRKFTDGDVQILQLVGDRIALAVHVGLHERERIVAETLQLSLLPESLPNVFGIDFSARYLPGGAGMVGGDWYDAFILPNGHIALAVGDVVGRGMRAASVMGRLRNALRAYAFEGLAPAKVVDSLNSMMHFLDPEEMATLVYAVLDPESRAMSVVNAGHLPIVVARPRRPAEFFERSGTPPLGARSSLRSIAHVLELEPGSTVLFYTDGLVERRTIPLNDRLESLRQIVESDPALDDLAPALISQLAAEDADDDVAILAVRFSADVSGPYQIRVPAQPAQLAQVRSMMRAWLSDLHIPGNLAYDVLVATGEACANAIEHAYGPQAGEVEISVSRSESRLAVSVKDAGSWREARGEDRGRGLPIMQKLATSVDVVRTERGTDVRLGWNLGGSAFR